VLPLVNATANADMDYLADGITEGVINHLSRLPGLRVMARSTVFRYRQTQQDPLQIGQRLHVAAVVVGRLAQHGDTVNVETEMVNVSNGSQIWGEQYRRKASDVATIQDDIASDISAQLRLKLTGEQKKRWRSTILRTAKHTSFTQRAGSTWSAARAIACTRRLINLTRRLPKTLATHWHIQDWQMRTPALRPCFCAAG